MNDDLIADQGVINGDAHQWCAFPGCLQAVTTAGVAQTGDVQHRLKYRRPRRSVQVTHQYQRTLCFRSQCGSRLQVFVSNLGTAAGNRRIRVGGDDRETTFLVMKSSNDRQSVAGSQLTQLGRDRLVPA